MTFFIENSMKRSETSCYHGSKISGSQQALLTETATCIVERKEKRLGYRFVPGCNHAQESHTRKERFPMNSLFASNFISSF